MVTLLWVIVWFIGYQGFQRFSKVAIFIMKFTVLCLPVMFVVLVGGYRKLSLRDFESGASNIFSNEVIYTEI